MTLAERVRIILKESGLNQKNFAKSINVTDSYISKLLRNESGMSNTTALLIEEFYGYSKNWLLNGEEPIKTSATPKMLTPIKRKLLADIEQMNPEEIEAVYAYVKTLEAIRKKDYPSV
jgi:transcriptional regulator with XRE-family HTH domain